MREIGIVQVCSAVFFDISRDGGWTRVAWVWVWVCCFCDGRIRFCFGFWVRMRQIVGFSRYRLWASDDFPKDSFDCSVMIGKLIVN